MVYCKFVTLMVTYRTRANNGRGFNSKTIFWASRLPHKKHIKNAFSHDLLGGRPLIESVHYWHSYGKLIYDKFTVLLV